MSDEEARPTAPGWYPDPWSATGKGERYFDGKNWGSSERPLARQTTVSLDEQRRARRSRTSGRSRPALAVLAAVAAVAVGVWLVVRRSSPQPAPRDSAAALGTTAPRPGVTTTTIFGLLGVDYHRGDCVVWEQTPAATHPTDIVPCSSAHLIEISGRVDLGNHFDHFPRDAEFQGIYRTDCAPQLSALIGRPLDPNGKFGATAIHPSKAGWDDGDRTIWCGASAIDQTKPLYSYLLPLFTGKVEGADQTLLEPVGSCWSSTSPYELPCTGPHQWEVTGYADLAGRTSAPPPEQDTTAWHALVGGACDLNARGYLGHAPSGDLRAGWIAIPPQSWSIGRRKAECTLARYRDTTLLTSVGSAKQ